MFTLSAWFELLGQHGLESQPAALRAMPLYARSSSMDCASQVPKVDTAPLALLWLWLPAPEQGRGWRALSSYYSSLYGLQWLVPAPVGADVLDWPRWVREWRQWPGSERLQLAPLDPEDACWHFLCQALQNQGYWCGHYQSFGNAYLPVQAGGFDAYWRQRPSVLRHTVERARRRLQREAPGWRITLTQTPGADLEQALEAYQAVYAQSWKTPEPCPQFMPELVRLAARQGWLRLGVLWLGEHPVAAQVWLVSGGVAHIYKLAYVQGMERWSAGSVLTAELMRHVLEMDRVCEVDYGQGDEPYKRDWMTQRRERIGLLACDLRRPTNWWLVWRHLAGRWLRRWQSRGFAGTMVR